jgi:hypothetical protein
MRLPAEVTSVEGFIDLVVQLASHGYYFWVQGDVRNRRGLSLQEIDRRQIERYNANRTKRARSYQRSKGNASVRYVRYGLEWHLFWTYGKNRVFEKYGPATPGGPVRFNDFRTSPSLKFHGYGVSLTRRGYHKKTAEEKADYRQRKAAAVAAGTDYRSIPRGRRHQRWVARVVINEDRTRLLQAELLGMATHRSVDTLRMNFYNVPFTPYAPIRAQLTTLLRQVNKARQHVGYDPVPDDCIRFRRKMTSPYTPVGVETAGSPSPNADISLPSPNYARQRATVALPSDGQDRPCLKSKSARRCSASLAAHGGRRGGWCGDRRDRPGFGRRRGIRLATRDR